MTGSELKTPLTRKDFASDLAVRWCPGCGDFAILAQVQKTMPELGVPRENIVFISGIGCSSRFPYYMNTYGIHSVHGRAPTLATGLKCARPELTVFVVTGDGDALSIGGNHFLHVLRRNIDINILLFNNRIYGLTKGQYSPTSEIGKKTKSSPDGSIDNPINPIGVAIGAETSFIARTVDNFQKHMAGVIHRAAEHTGTSLVEVAQNCKIFNNGAWKHLTDPDTKADSVLFLEHGQAHDFRQGRGEGHPPQRAHTRGGGRGRRRRGESARARRGRRGADARLFPEPHGAAGLPDPGGYLPLHRQAGLRPGPDGQSRSRPCRQSAGPGRAVYRQDGELDDPGPGRRRRGVSFLLRHPELARRGRVRDVPDQPDPRGAQRPPRSDCCWRRASTRTPWPTSSPPRRSPSTEDGHGAGGLRHHEGPGHRLGRWWWTSRAGSPASFTEREILALVADEGVGAGDRRVGELMTRDPETTTVTSTLAEVIQRLTVSDLRYLPILDGTGRPVSILAARDLVDFLSARIED